MISKRLAACVALAFAAMPTAALAQYNDLLQIVQSIGTKQFLDQAGIVDQSPSVRVVRLSTFAGAIYGPARLDAALYLKARDVLYLQRNLYNNPIAMMAIRNSGVALEQIVSLWVSRDRAAILYANDL